MRGAQIAAIVKLQSRFGRVHLHGDAAARRQEARRAIKPSFNTIEYEIDIVGYVGVGIRRKPRKSKGVSATAAMAPAGINSGSVGV
jgi:hypothetical protein